MTSSHLKRIGIIGAGWYGLYIASVLQNDYDVTIFDKESEIFTSSSAKNQNRLHLGFHYPRNYTTRSKCKKYFDLFLNKFEKEGIIETVNNNWYVISKRSLLDYQTYYSIYSYEHYDMELIDNNHFNNIDGKIINVSEKYINPEKVKAYFESILNVKYVLGYKVTDIQNNPHNIIINDEYEFDIVFNCTYNHISDNVSDCVYEKCIELLYKRINAIPFDCLTIMDGQFNSLYTYNDIDNIYSLTDVEFTPYYISKDINEIDKPIPCDQINNIIKNMEEKISTYYPSFKTNFEYHDYIVSYKCKNVTELENAGRNINIFRANRIHNIWCGKISFVVELDEYLNNIDKDI